MKIQNKILYPATHEVLAMADVNFGSNHVIPDSWFLEILLPIKKPRPDIPAILILSHIVYWYRPSKEKDEDTGVESYYKRFKGDLLQKSYKQLSRMYGLSETIVKRTILRLEKKKFIYRVIYEEGGKLYIGINPEEIKKITYVTGKSLSSGGGYKFDPPTNLTPGEGTNLTPLTYNTDTEITEEERVDNSRELELSGTNFSTGVDNHVDNSQTTPQEEEVGRDEECLPSATKAKPEPSPEAKEFARWFKTITTITATPTMLRNWATTYDDLVQKDKRDPEEIRRLCAWARADERFWMGPFKYASFLRKKQKGSGIRYYEIMLDQMNREQQHGTAIASAGNQKPTTGSKPESRADFARNWTMQDAVERSNRRKELARQYLGETGDSAGGGGEGRTLPGIRSGT